MNGRIFLGRYETIKLLGEGGMGRVYLAKQTDLGRHVVVKVMHEHVAADPKFRERFQREMLLMARFQHPYVVALYDASLTDPQGPCIVMEYVRGISLDTLLHRNTRLAPARVGRMLCQLCEALYAAHNEGIIHRDLKPANLMVVDPDTPYEKIKVMDFGLAKLIDNNSGMNMAHHQTNTGLDFAVGTPGYISPEQVRGEEADFRSDLYCVGVMLFELLTGRLPFIRDETMDVLFAHATEAPPTFEEVGASDWAPAEIEAVVMSCLAKNAVDRPHSARDLAESYQKALNAIVDRMEPDAVPPAPATGTPVPEKTDVVPKQPAIPIDPNSVVMQMEAWMPDAIATFKLRGFVQDNNGEVLENAPGRIKMRLGADGSRNQSAFSWLGFGHKSSIVDVELHLERTNPQQQNLLHITVVMSSPHWRSADAAWRERCNEVFCELRSYLAGAVVTNS
ncbi:MAG: serine/threonine protein kinase [Planctomycetes bacterium]|nr:serine/threonine protein kinase [Planctomycetota bacterium]